MRALYLPVRYVDGSPSQISLRAKIFYAPPKGSRVETDWLDAKLDTGASGTVVPQGAWDLLDERNRRANGAAIVKSGERWVRFGDGRESLGPTYDLGFVLSDLQDNVWPDPRVPIRPAGGVIVLPCRDVLVGLDLLVACAKASYFRENRLVMLELE